MYGCEVVWAIKDQSISHTFVDEGAATFFLPHLVGSISTDSASPGAEGKDQLLEIKPLKRAKYVVDTGQSQEVGGASNRDSDGDVAAGSGSALGPDWHTNLMMKGRAFDAVSFILLMIMRCDTVGVCRMCM